MDESSKEKFQSSIYDQSIQERKEELDARYFDFNEDSISMTSNTSTVPSSFVRQRIQDHDMKKSVIIRDQIDPQINHNNVVINFVLNADNSHANSNSFTEVVNEILSHTSIPKKENTSKQSQWNMERFYTNIRRPKYITCMLMILIAFIGLAFGLYIILSVNKANSTDTTTTVSQLSTTIFVDKTTTESTSSISTSTNPTDTTKTTHTTQLVTTTELPATTEDIPLDPKHVIISRAEWGAKPMTGNRKQSRPIDRVVFMQTYTNESCITEVNQSN